MHHFIHTKLVATNVHHVHVTPVPSASVQIAVNISDHEETAARADLANETLPICCEKRLGQPLIIHVRGRALLLTYLLCYTFGRQQLC